jgi:glycosyltransferase involved in cell wall biosynthesis
VFGFILEKGDNRMNAIHNEHGISIVACTNKVGFMDNIFSNYQNQILQEKELIIILNNDSLDINEWTKKAESYDNVQVYQLPEETTLGSCMNFAIDKAKFKYVANFDDDDYYGGHYLNEVLKAFENTSADIVGKKGGFLYFANTKELRVRYTKKVPKAVTAIAGGSIAAKKAVMKDIPFLDINLGIDGGFLLNAESKGYRIHLTSHYNYAYIRRDNSQHTWKTTNKFLKRGSKHIGFMDDISSIVDKEIFE